VTLISIVIKASLIHTSNLDFKKFTSDKINENLTISTYYYYSIVLVYEATWTFNHLKRAL
jgi:hypothetical protein